MSDHEKLSVISDATLDRLLDVVFNPGFHISAEHREKFREAFSVALLGVEALSMAEAEALLWATDGTDNLLLRSARAKLERLTAQLEAEG